MRQPSFSSPRVSLGPRPRVSAGPRTRTRTGKRRSWMRFRSWPTAVRGGELPKFPYTPRKGIPTCSKGRRVSQGYGSHQGGPARPPAFVPSTFAPQGKANGGQPGPPPYRSPASIQGPTQVHQQPFSNVMKRHANWNACYSCGFDIADGHTSMSCPAHLRKATHDIYFNHQNSQQYIDLGHPCSTKNRHKTHFPNM